MGLKPPHRCFLLGLLVLGCVGLAHTTATGGAAGPKEQSLLNAAKSAFVDLETTNFVAVCDTPLTAAGTCNAAAANAVAMRLFEVGKFFAGHELSLEKAKLSTITKADLVDSGLAYGFGGPAGSLASLEDSARVAWVAVGELPATEKNIGIAGFYNRSSGMLHLGPSILSQPTDTTIAHELFHAVQVYYMPELDLDWILEATAVAAEAAAAHPTDFNARRNYRKFGDWRNWAHSLGTADGKTEYETGEFFLEVRKGRLDYMKALFGCLELAWPINGPLQSYRAMEECPSFDLEFAYQYLIAVRSTENYPHMEEWKCVEGSTCAGADHLPLRPMAAEYQEVTLNEPQCGPGEVRTIPPPPWSLAFTVNAGDPSKFKMLIPDVRPMFIPPDTPVTLHTDKVKVWVINHNSQATSEAEHTYSFVAKRDPVSPPCQKKSVKWRGEGSIQAEFNADNLVDHVPVWRSHKRGVFTITFRVQEDGMGQGEETVGGERAPAEVGPIAGMIQGEGTITVTATGEYADIAPEWTKLAMHCTGSVQATESLIVQGWQEGSVLKLLLHMVGLPPSSDAWSCTGPGAAWRRPDLHLIDPIVLWGEQRPLVVAAEDGATGYSVADLSSGEGFSVEGLPAAIKRTAVWSLRIKALPPEEGGSPPVSGGAGQSSPEFPPLP